MILKSIGDCDSQYNILYIKLLLFSSAVLSIGFLKIKILKIYSIKVFVTLYKIQVRINKQAVDIYILNKFLLSVYINIYRQQECDLQ